MNKCEKRRRTGDASSWKMSSASVVMSALPWKRSRDERSWFALDVASLCALTKSHYDDVLRGFTVAAVDLAEKPTRDLILCL